MAHQLKENSRGRWVLHEKGCQKLSSLAAAYQLACRERLGPGLSGFEFHPWMASVSLAESFVRGGLAPQTFSSKGLLETDLKSLQSIEQLLDSVHTSGAMQGYAGIAVLRDIASHSCSLQVYREAITLIKSWPLWQSRLFQNIISLIIPIYNPVAKMETGNAFSDPNFAGAIFTSVNWGVPYPAVDLTISFAHELGHQALYLYQQSGDLFFNSSDWVYSALRDSLRPVVSAFHAVSALAYMLECARALLRSERDVGRIAYLRTLIDQYRQRLQTGLNEVLPLEKSELCRKLCQDLSLLLG